MDIRRMVRAREIGLVIIKVIVDRVAIRVNNV